MLESQTVSISIQRPWSEVYEAIWRPESFPTWASGLTTSTLCAQPDGSWRAQGQAGSVTIRFTAHNPFGVMDHWIRIADGTEVYVPMRVIANQDGADVALTLFCQPGMSRERFLQDIDWVRRDLVALRMIFD